MVSLCATGVRLTLLSIRTHIALWPLSWCLGTNLRRTTTVEQPVSRECAVAQYAVLEANVKVNGRGQFSHSNSSETPQPISMSCEIYYYVPKRIDVQNLAGIDSAVTNLRMREKHDFVWIFLINISISPPVSSSGLQVTVLWRFLRLMAQTTLFRNH